MINSEMEHSWRQEGNILLRDDERIDDLQRNHYGIIQRKGTFCFGMDAVLLSGFAVVKPGENAKDGDIIFKKLITLGRTNEILPKWAEQAGIKKHITFHTARHTHATMLLTLGVDLYTVSKLLGHTNIQTTQIYAKLVDESKKKAIDLIPSIT